MSKLLFLAAGAALFSLGAARADGPPDTTFPPTQYFASIGSTVLRTQGTIDVGHDSATTGFAGTPFVEADGTDVGVHPLAQATWQFELQDPRPDKLIPILITGAFDLSATGAGTASIAVLLDILRSDPSLLFSASCNGSGPACGEQPLLIHALVDPHAEHDLSIGAGGGVSSGFGSFNSFLDPMISLDFSTGFDFSGVTLEVAPDAQPPGGSATPEPASWTLMILGLGGVGAAVRRRRGLAVA